MNVTNNSMNIFNKVYKPKKNIPIPVHPFRQPSPKDVYLFRLDLIACQDLLRSFHVTNFDNLVVRNAVCEIHRVSLFPEVALNYHHQMVKLLPIKRIE